MGRVKEIEKIFEPWPLLIVVAKHQRKRRRHQPLSAGSAFRRELPDAEDQIDDGKKLFFLPQEVHEYAQRDEREAVFVHIQVGNDARYKISAQMSGKGQNIIEKLNPEKAAEKEESLPTVFLRDTPGGRPPCLHERASGGQRTASGIYAVSCPHRGPDGEGIFPSETFDGADQNAGQKHGEEDVMVAIAVRGGKTAVEKITESGHEKAHQIQPQQIALPAAGMAVALNHAEQKQGIAQPSEPVQPYRRSVKIAADVIQNHQNQGGHFQGKGIHRKPPDRMFGKAGRGFPPAL